MPDSSPILVRFDPDGEYVATMADFPHMSAHGLTPNGAIRDLFVVLGLQIGAYMEQVTDLKQRLVERAAAVELLVSERDDSRLRLAGARALIGDLAALTPESRADLHQRIAAALDEQQPYP